MPSKNQMTSLLPSTNISKRSSSSFDLLPHLISDNKHDKKPEKKNFLLFFALFFLLLMLSGLVGVQCNPNTNRVDRHQLLVISLDGFRYDYYDYVEMASLKRLTSRGVHALNGMKGVFSSVTFASHWTLATGLFEESHGIIANDFYDPVLDKTFNKTSNERYWFGGEPIWVTAKRQGLKTGIWSWVGSYTDQGPFNPDHRQLKYNHSVPLRNRCQDVVEWLTVDQMDLVMMYWHEPDSAGHEFGSFSEKTVNALQFIDSQLIQMFSELESRGRSLSNLNVIILSDHGVVNMTTNSRIIIPKEATQDLIKYYTSDGVVAHFWPKEGVSEEALVKSLRQHTKDNPDNRERGNNGQNVTFYSKRNGDLPSRWRYQNNVRIGAVVAVADEAFFMEVQQEDNNKIMKKRKKSSSKDKIGRHGYDNDLPSMRPLFLASGPNFKENYTFSETIDMIDMYSLFCNLLSIQPSVNNGSVSRVVHVLRNPPKGVIEGHFTSSAMKAKPVFFIQHHNHYHLYSTFLSLIWVSLVYFLVFHAKP